MKKVKWGVLGTAGIARSQTIPGMQLAENCELYAIAGRSLEKAEQFQKDFGFEKTFGSYEELLADQAVEAVYIPLPNALHGEWTIKALKAGKHVLCEKPVAPTASEAQEMIDAANASGVYLMEAFAYLHSPFVQAVKAEIGRGTIGDVVYLESAFVTCSHDDRNIRMRRDTFGGALYDIGCYNTSLVLWMLEKEPEEVMAAAHFTHQGIDDYTSALLRFPGGVTAALECGMVLAPESGTRIDRFQIHGTKGCILSDTRFNQAGEVSYTVSVNGKTETKTLIAPNNYQLEVEQLGRCILEGEFPYVSHDFTMLNARTMDRILTKIGY